MLAEERMNLEKYEPIEISCQIRKRRILAPFKIVNSV